MPQGAHAVATEQPCTRTGHHAAGAQHELAERPNTGALQAPAACPPHRLAGRARRGITASGPAQGISQRPPQGQQLRPLSSPPQAAQRQQRLGCRCRAGCAILTPASPPPQGHDAGNTQDAAAGRQHGHAAERPRARRARRRRLRDCGKVHVLLPGLADACAHGAARIRQSHASVYAAMLSAPLRLFIKQATSLSACMQAHNVFARSTPQCLASFSANMQLPARLPWALTAHMAGAHYSHHARCPVPARMTC